MPYLFPDSISTHGECDLETTGVAARFLHLPGDHPPGQPLLCETFSSLPGLPRWTPAARPGRSDKKLTLETTQLGLLSGNHLSNLLGTRMPSTRCGLRKMEFAFYFPQLGPCILLPEHCLPLPRPPFSSSDFNLWSSLSTLNSVRRRRRKRDI